MKVILTFFSFKGLKVCGHIKCDHRVSIMVDTKEGSHSDRRCAGLNRKMNLSKEKERYTKQSDPN